MKFYTVAWSSGSMTDKRAKEVRRKALAHFESIKDRLSPDLVELWNDYGLHDGRLIELRVDTLARTATMIIDGWNNFSGEFPVLWTLSFSEVDTVRTFRNKVSKRYAAQAYPDLGYFEIDLLEDGRCQMNFLFLNGVEIEVRFGSIAIGTEKS